ncbi:MAG: TRAP transporter fused permease subunit [Pseudolabrys sp.]|nr:TRAP transporter fused permease subunit [Pseudolabrys sp.]
MRTLSGPARKLTILVLASATLFHLWYVGVDGTLPSTLLRSVHLAFLIPIAFLLYPAGSKSPQGRPSIVDITWALFSLLATMYIVVNYSDVEDRIELVSSVNLEEMILGCVALVTLAEITRRTMGLGMAIVLTAAVVYLLVGSYLPGGFGFRPIPFERTIEMLYLGKDDGIFGSLTDISVNELFLFVFFGVVMSHTGIGDWFSNISSAFAGQWTGGAGKVTVINSALFGSVSGSPTADLYATGSYTIPLMIRSGFTPSYAAGVAAASAIGAQIMPPLMGASVFIMATLLQRSYASIVEAAIIPAALFFMSKATAVHFQAKREGIRPLRKEDLPSKLSALQKSYYILPVLLLIFFLYSGYSPIRAAMFGIGAAALLSFVKRETWLTPKRLVNVLVEGAQAALLIAVPCAAAGVIVSVLTQTGLGLALGTFITDGINGQLYLGLLLVAFLAIVLGIGVPTTPAYILTAAVGVSTLIALGVSPLSAHMFVFYFAVLSNIHPPVGITAYAAASIAKADPFATGIQAFKVALPGFVVAFSFAFHPVLLLEGTPAGLVFWFCVTGLSVTIISSGLAGYMLRPLMPWERVLLCVAGIALILPDVRLTLAGMAALMLSFGTQMWLRHKEHLAVARDVDPRMPQMPQLAARPPNRTASAPSMEER